MFHLMYDDTGQLKYNQLKENPPQKSDAIIIFLNFKKSTLIIK